MAAKTRSNKAGYDRNYAGTTVEWTSPQPVVKALSPFDLDPCTHAGGMPWRTATTMLTPKEDGLATPWDPRAFVWMNPPYGKGQDQWMKKLADHGHGIALVLSRTDTAWFHTYVFQHPNAKAVLFTRGRIQFCDRKGNQLGGCPTGAVFVAYGQEAVRRLRRALAEGALAGELLTLARVEQVAPAAVAAKGRA